MWKKLKFVGLERSENSQETVNQLMNQFFNFSLHCQISGGVLADQYCGLCYQFPMSFQVILKSAELTGILAYLFVFCTLQSLYALLFKRMVENQITTNFL